ncbi:MAG: endonuclease domain-containing protein [Rhizobiaceae bacterium]
MPHEIVAARQRTNAKAMRKVMTDAERRLWNQLRAHRVMGLGFRRQVPVGKYVADFACSEHRLVVEIDGSHHGLPEAVLRDQIRTAALGETGWTILRFWNDDVMRDLENVCGHIVAWVLEKSPIAPPSAGFAGISPARGESGAQIQIAEKSR